MKNKLKILIFIVSFIFLLAPIINANTFYVKFKNKDWSYEDAIIDLYNFDFIQQFTAYAFYIFGLSLNPKDVIAGEGGWLFFNQQSTTFSVNAPGDNQNYFNKLKGFSHYWENRITTDSAHKFYFVVLPDKHVVYADKAPQWMKKFDQKNGVVLFPIENPLDDSFLYVGDAIKKARLQFDYPLFYKTDTHWNQLGAWVGYQAIAEAVRRQNPQISWLKPDALQVIAVKQTAGMDSARLLKIQKWVSDDFIDVSLKNSGYIFEASYWDGSGIYRKGSDPMALLHDSPTKPLLIKTKKALNESKLLWLTDSFGVAMEPYMATTFSTTLHVYCGRNTGKDFQKIIDDFQPDITIIMFVDRSMDRRECIIPPL